MKKFVEAVANPKVQVAYWSAMTLIWVVLLLPSLLLWKDSILWIIVMSWWANVAASAAAAVAAHGELKAKQRDEGSNHDSASGDDGTEEAT